ncbi:hypothetical protein [Streptomyces misionensis]|uniref:hypothetical protein n=1 Tax=Streptomyces misionensis TaxID=67331 RepID=UPI0036ACCD32
MVRDIRALSDTEAVRALTVLVEDRGLLSWAREIGPAEDELGQALRAAGVEPGEGDGGNEPPGTARWRDGP